VCQSKDKFNTLEKTVQSLSRTSGTFFFAWRSGFMSLFFPCLPIDLISYPFPLPHRTLFICISIRRRTILLKPLRRILVLHPPLPSFCLFYSLPFSLANERISFEMSSAHEVCLTKGTSHSNTKSLSQIKKECKVRFSHLPALESCLRL
jgi:hypothetical protein